MNFRELVGRYYKNPAPRVGWLPMSDGKRPLVTTKSTPLEGNLQPLLAAKSTVTRSKLTTNDDYQLYYLQRIIVAAI